MAEKSSAQPKSDIESSEPLGASSVMGEPTNGLTQATTEPSVGGGDSILPLEPNVELAPSSSKKRRGRPPGSKNKPKNIPVTEQINNVMEPITLGIPAGNDIIESVISFAQSRNTSITVLGGSGLVADVTLLDKVSRAPNSPIKGTFNIISLKGSYIIPSCESVPPESITEPACSSFTIVLSGDEGQAICGTIGGKVKAVGYVKVTATLLRGLSLADEPHQ